MDKDKPQPTTYLGNKELHQRHKVMVEGGAVPRARVMDQHVIDAYLMGGIIDLKQHRGGEYLLGQAARAGLWATGANLSGSMTQGGKRDHVPMGVMPYGDTLNAVEKRHGPYHRYIVKRVVCDDHDVSGNQHNMEVLREALGFIADQQMGWKANPLYHIRGLKKKGRPTKPPKEEY